MTVIRFKFNGWDDSIGRYVDGQRREVDDKLAATLVADGVAEFVHPSPKALSDAPETASQPPAENTSKSNPAKSGKGKAPRRQDPKRDASPTDPASD